MNLVLDALNDVISGAEQRMDDAGVPRIVRERCYVCGGRGTIEQRTPYGIALDYCRCCASNGWIAREAA